MDALDITLLNIISFCGGVLSTFLFVFCYEGRRFGRISRQNYIDGAMNHHQPTIIQALPPPSAPLPY